VPRRTIAGFGRRFGERRRQFRSFSSDIGQAVSSTLAWLAFLCRYSRRIIGLEGVSLLGTSHVFATTQDALCFSRCL
jgi:hypothetical protein